MIALTLLLLSTSGQDSLTLGQAVRQAMSTHPVVRSAQSSVRQAEATAREHRAARIPEVAIEATAVRFQEPMIVAPLHAFDPARPPVFNSTLLQSRVLANYLLFDGGRRGAAIRQSDAVLDAGQETAAGARMDLIARIATAYLNVITAETVVSASDRQLAALDAERARIELLLETGRAARVDLLRIEAVHAQATAAAAGARGSLASHRRRLERDLGLEAGALQSVRISRSVLSANPSIPASGAAMSAALAANPQLLAARARTEAALAARGVSAAARLPSLRVSGGYQTFGSAAGNFSAEWQAGVSISYPLFRAQRSHRIARSEAAAAEAEETEAVIALDVEQLVDQIHRSVTTGRARVHALEQAVQHLEEVVRIEQLALTAGAGVQAEYLRAEADLFERRSQLAQARTALLIAHVSLARTTGELTPDWIESVLESSP